MRCPHCGTTNPGHFEDNGLRPSDPDYTLLCVNPLPADETCDPEFYADPHNSDVPVICGMQWEPNSERDQ